MHFLTILVSQEKQITKKKKINVRLKILQEKYPTNKKITEIKVRLIKQK